MEQIHPLPETKPSPILGSNQQFDLPEGIYQRLGLEAKDAGDQGYDGSAGRCFDEEDGQQFRNFLFAFERCFQLFVIGTGPPSAPYLVFSGRCWSSFLVCGAQ